MIILEGYCPKIHFSQMPDDKNSHMYIRTLSFMKKDYFFVSECGYWIKHFYHLQSEHEFPWIIEYFK